MRGRIDNMTPKQYVRNYYGTAYAERVPIHRYKGKAYHLWRIRVRDGGTLSLSYHSPGPAWQDASVRVNRMLTEAQ